MEELRELGILGIKNAYNIASERVDNYIKKRGEGFKIGFPDTDYFLPLSYAAFGKEIKTLKEAAVFLREIEKAIPDLEKKDLIGLVDISISAAIALEVIEVLKYNCGNPYQDGWQGFVPDNASRSLGLQLVDGRIKGAAIIIGAAPDSKIAAQLVRDLQQRNILSLLIGNCEGITFLEQLKKEKVDVGFESYIVALGSETTSFIYAANFAFRTAFIYGNSKKGEAEKILNYCRQRLPFFVMALGGFDGPKVVGAMAAIRMGFPVITDQDVSEVPKMPYTNHEALLSEKDYRKIINRGILASGIKLGMPKIDIPVYYGPAFEGEKVRREAMYVQFGGKYSTAFEFLSVKDLKDIDDEHIEVVGPEIDEMNEGETFPLGILVEVAGRGIRSEYEPILERRVHTFLNEASGIFHIGQRDACWIRISEEAKNKGFKIRHFGVILHAGMHNIFGTIVDKVSVKLYTSKEELQLVLSEAKKSYELRDTRMKEMSDESVDTFYSCGVCQSFAANHICIIKPERLGLCGAYNWLDAKMSHELNPTGPNQPVKKARCLDAVKGEWMGVNAFIYQNSNKALERFFAYSIMECPETSCSYFECIVAIIPETNGFMIVNREFPGLTPAGENFTTLAGSVGSGTQTPGFMGIGRLYIISRKFLKADGGLKRIVWIPTELKESLADKLNVRAKEEGMPDLIEKIADETVADNMEDLLKYLKKVRHPALEMESLV